MKMLGRFCAVGPGGRDCACCGDAPGKPRKAAKRTLKRRERQSWQRDTRTNREAD